MTGGCDSTQVPCPCWSCNSLSCLITTRQGLAPSPSTVPWVTSLWVPAPPRPPLAMPMGAREHPLGPVYFFPIRFHGGSPDLHTALPAHPSSSAQGVTASSSCWPRSSSSPGPRNASFARRALAGLDSAWPQQHPPQPSSPSPCQWPALQQSTPAPKPSPEGANGNGEPGPGDTARGRQQKPRATQVQHPQRGYHAPGAPQQHPDPVPATGALGTPCTQGTRGFSQDKPACQGSWVINISLPGLFLARGRAAEAFPQLFQHAAPLRGVRSSHTGQVSTLQASPGDALGCVLPFQPAPGHAQPGRGAVPSQADGTAGTSPPPLRVSLAQEAPEGVTALSQHLLFEPLLQDRLLPSPPAGTYTHVCAHACVYFPHSTCERGSAAAFPTNLDWFDYSPALG